MRAPLRGFDRMRWRLFSGGIIRSMRLKTIGRRLVPLTAFALTALAWATPASAHSVNKRFGDFYGGMLHPVTAVEHLFPVLALGLLAGQQGARVARWVVLAFPIGLCVGVMLGTNFAPNDYISWTNKISLLVLGLLVAASVRVPLSGLLAIALLLGAAHGYEYTAGIPQRVTMHMFLPGMLVSGIALVAVMAATAVSLRLPWQQIALRVAGSWIAAIGLLSIGVG